MIPSGRDNDVARFQVSSARSTSPATIRRSDGTSLRGTGLALGHDTLDWSDPRSGIAHEVPTSDIDRVTFRDHGKGGLEGLGLGLLAGAALGVFLGVAQADEQCVSPCATVTSEGKAFVGGVIGAGVGAVLGGALGYVAGHREAYTFSRLGSEGDPPRPQDLSPDRDREQRR